MSEVQFSCDCGARWTAQIGADPIEVICPNCGPAPAHPSPAWESANGRTTEEYRSAWDRYGPPMHPSGCCYDCDRNPDNLRDRRRRDPW